MRKRVAFVSEPPPVKKARAEGIAISDSRPSTASKSPTTLRRLSRLSEQGDASFGSAVPATEDVTSSSITPTPKHVLEDASHDNVRTRPSSVPLLVTSGSAGVNVPVAESAGDGHRSPGSRSTAGDLSATPNQDSSADDFFESQTIDSASAQNVYAALRNQYDVRFLDAININSAQHVCMVFELRLRYEHKIMTREKFEKKFMDRAALIQQRDAEIADLRVRLEKYKAEAVEVTELRKPASDLEATVAVKDGELANLHTKNVGLAEEFISQQDAAERRFKERAAELDARIADVRRDMDNDLYPLMLTAIAGRRTPTLSFMRLFGCPDTILKTIDHLGKFDGKVDKGFFVGYSLNSKAFRVFNSRTKIVEEKLHIRFSESTPNVVGSGPNWLFDIDALTRTMNYKPIVASTQSNGFAGTKASNNVGQARKETESVKDYILLPLWTADPPFSQDLKSSPDDGSKPSSDDRKKVDDDGSKPSSDDGKKVDGDPRKESECNDQEKEDNVNSTNNVNTISLTVNAASTNEVNDDGENISSDLPFDPTMPALEDDSIFDFTSDDEYDDAVADMNNLDITIQVSSILTTRIHKDHPLDQVIGDLQSATQTRKMSKNLNEHGFVSTIQQRTTHKDLQNCLFACFLSHEEPKKIEEEVYVCQPPGFEDPDFPDRVYKVEKALYGLHQAPRAWYETLSTYLLDNEFQRGKFEKNLFIKRHKGGILLVQVYVDDIIFGSTKKELCFAFKKLMHEKFQMSSIGELTFFLGLQVKQKKDGIFISQDKYVDEI
ncbi:putative ribonuclease H-like domain-containing protein [Tanacetum coccineum]